MNLKTYRARTIAEALAEVKKDLGKEAVILNTRSLKVGGVMGLGSRAMVEITAAPGGQINRVPARPAPRPMREAVAVGAAPDSFTAWTAPRKAAAAHVSQAPTLESVPRASEAPSPQTRPGSPRPDLATVASFAPSDPRARLILEDELSSIKRLVGQVLQCTRHAQAHHQGAPAGESTISSAAMTLGPMSEPLFANYMRLVEGQVSPEIAEALAGTVRQELSGAELADPAIVRATLLRLLADRMPVTGEPPRRGRAGESRPLTIALVGPTGVGKTTTLAKLAAVYKLRHGRRVGMVTCDTYRIAAVEQLRTYAGIIGLPLKVVNAPSEAEAACRSLESCDVVLVDTAGRSQHDAGRIDELRQLLAAVRPHETHLVLSAAAAEPVMMKAADRFGVLRPDRLLFTKLDEAVHFGPLLNAIARTGLSVGHITTGQEVPDHIEPAESHRLARAILDGEVAT